MFCTPAHPRLMNPQSVARVIFLKCTHLVVLSLLQSRVWPFYVVIGNSHFLWGPSMAFIQWPLTIGGMSCYSCLLQPPQPPRIFLPLSQWPCDYFCRGVGGIKKRELPSSRIFSPSFHLTLFWTPRLLFISALFPFGSLLWSSCYEMSLLSPFVTLGR